MEKFNKQDINNEGEQLHCISETQWETNLFEEILIQEEEEEN